MNEPFIPDDKGYGFKVTKFTDTHNERFYHITNTDTGSSVALTAWQMMQLFSHCLLYINQTGQSL
jgi:hypothetical protein